MNVELLKCAIANGMIDLPYVQEQVDFHDLTAKASANLKTVTRGF